MLRYGHAQSGRVDLELLEMCFLSFLRVKTLVSFLKYIEINNIIITLVIQTTVGGGMVD